VLFLGAAELAAGAAPAAPRLVRTAEHAPLRLGPDAERAAVALPAVRLAGDDVLRVTLLEIPSAPAGLDVRVAVRAGDVLAGERRVRVAGRAVVDVPLARPAGAQGGGVEVALERDPANPHAGVVVPGASIQHLRRDATERRASLVLFARFTLALIGLGALALGLGAWMRASLAGLVTLSAWLCAWAFDLGRGIAPGADLAAAVRLVGEGVVPPAPGAGPALGCAACVALGVALGRRGTWGGSGAP
jgi:hypothetical protein